MIRSEKGFGLIQVILTLGVIALIALSVVQLNQSMNSEAAITKSQVGRDSIASGLLSAITMEATCSSQLFTNIPFNALAAQAPGTAYNTKQNLVFKIGTIGQIGWVNPSASSTPTFVPALNAYVGSIYFKTTSQMANEKATSIAALSNANVYLGSLMANVARPTENGYTEMADVQISDKFTLWVKNNVIVGCGIVKTPEQICVDDVGGTFTQTPAATFPQCTNIPTPCGPTQNGYYYLGLKPDGKTPICMKSPASCASANQTVVSDGNGGWSCVAMP